MTQQPTPEWTFALPLTSGVEQNNKFRSIHADNRMHDHYDKQPLFSWRRTANGWQCTTKRPAILEWHTAKGEVITNWRQANGRWEQPESIGMPAKYAEPDLSRLAEGATPLEAQMKAAELWRQAVLTSEPAQQ